MGDATAFEGAIGQFDNGLDKLRDVWDDLVRRVNWLLNKLPSVLADKLLDMFDELAAKVTELNTNLVKLVTERGSASAVVAAGDSWNHDVGHRASVQSGLLDLAALKTDNSWSGDAADRYREAAAAQGRALTQVKTITEALHSTLNEIVSAMTSFWTGVAIALAVYYAAMVGVVAICATGVGAPEGIAAGTAATVAMGTTCLSLYNAYVNTLREKKAKLDQLTTMESGFVNKAWPSTATDRMTEWIPD